MQLPEKKNTINILIPMVNKGEIIPDATGQKQLLGELDQEGKSC